MVYEFMRAQPASKIENDRITIEVGDGETSDWYILDHEIEQLVCDLVPDGGASGRFETTNDIAGVVQTDDAVGIAWPDGDVAVATNGLCSGVVAIRLVSASGICKAYLNGVR